jgi:hypothetical protein
MLLLTLCLLSPAQFSKQPALKEDINGSVHKVKNHSLRNIPAVATLFSLSDPEPGGRRRWGRGEGAQEQDGHVHRRERGGAEQDAVRQHGHVPLVPLQGPRILPYGQAGGGHDGPSGGLREKQTVVDPKSALTLSPTRFGLFSSVPLFECIEA